MITVKPKPEPLVQNAGIDEGKITHRVPWTSRFGPRSSGIEYASPIIGLIKAVIDPVVVATVLFLVAYLREGEVTGLVFCMGFMALLLSGYLLNGSMLFFRGLEPSKDLFYFLLGWASIILTLLTIGSISGYAELMDPVLFFQWALFAPISLLALHGFIYWIFRRVARSNQATGLATIIVGANVSGQALANQITQQPLTKLQFLGFCDDRSAVRLSVPDSSVLTNLADLPEFVRKHNVARIYITLSMTSQPRTLELLDALKDTTTSIYFVPDMFVFDFIQAGFDEVGGIPVISMCESPFEGISGISKRVSDVILSIAILALIWPLLLIIALVVKLTSPGPAIFVQRRYGLDGREIKVYKFRSMAVLEDGGNVTQATRGDSRLTPIGGFLRRTSLDELPQFINVLQGRMSVVGPRPHANTHNELYRKLIKGYMVRYKVRPGITGWAQVNGARGETDTIEKMERRIELDLLYLRNWSVWLDLNIIFRTIVIMLRDRSAY